MALAILDILTAHKPCLALRWQRGPLQRKFMFQVPSRNCHVSGREGISFPFVCEGSFLLHLQDDGVVSRWEVPKWVASPPRRDLFHQHNGSFKETAVDGRTPAPVWIS